MINPWMIYFISAVDGIKIMMTFFSIVFLCVSLVSFMAVLNDNVSPKYPLISLAIFLILSLFSVSIPSSKTLTAMIFLPKIEQSEFGEEAKKLPLNTVKLLNEWIEDLAKEKER